jgi:hypothetical protein
MRKLLVVLGLGFVVKKVLDSRRQPVTSTEGIDREMDRQGFPGGVRP